MFKFYELIRFYNATATVALGKSSKSNHQGLDGSGPIGPVVCRKISSNCVSLITITHKTNNKYWDVKFVQITVKWNTVTD